VLVAVGVNAQGHRELLALEAAAEEEAAAWRWRNLLRGLVERGLRGVKLVISDDHEGIKAAVAAELPGVAWQRCVVHFERNVLAQVPEHAREEVAGDLGEIFALRRRERAEMLAQEFSGRWRGDFPRAVEVFARGIGDALAYLDFPGAHHRRIRTTNGLERLFQEMKRRTRVVGVFPNERSLVVLTTAVR